MVLRGTIHAAVTDKYGPMLAIYESEGHDLVMIIMEYNVGGTEIEIEMIPFFFSYIHGRNRGAMSDSDVP